MQNADNLFPAIIMLLFGFLIFTMRYTELLIQRDEPVTITTTILSCRTELVTVGRDRKEKVIYLKISQRPNQIRYGDPEKYKDALLQRCALGDRVKLTYYRRHFPLIRRLTYELVGMESLTDGQIIFTPADIEASRRWDWCLVLPTVIVFLCISFFFFNKWLTYKPDPQEIERRKSRLLKNKFEMDKKEVIKALRIDDPQDVRAWLILGWMMAEEKRPERASECYERALKINLRSYEAEELSALSLPTWLDLVARSEEMPLISFDVYPSPQKNRIPLPNWLDEGWGASLFSRLRRLLLSPLEVWFFLFVTLPFGSILSGLFFGEEAPRTLFLMYSFAIIMGVLPFISIFYMLKISQVSKNSHDWPLSEAIVIGSFARCWTSKGKHYHKLYLVCAYQVDQHIYYSTVRSKNLYLGSAYYSGGGWTVNSLEQEEKRYRFPKRMTVFYNPRQPDMVLDRAGFKVTLSDLLAAVIVFVLLPWFMSYIFWQAPT